MKQEIVITKDLNKNFFSNTYNIKAVKNVSISAWSGEILMLVGPSGCGKTTLLSLISGILKADSGSCKILGEEITNMNDSYISKFRGKFIGFVFQSFLLLPNLSVLENVTIPLLINGEKEEIAIQKSEQALYSVGLNDKKQFSPKELSGGQQQRVAIARSIVHSPSLIVCDEPTSALDIETGMSILNTLQEIAKNLHKSIIIVTHDSRIFKYADRILNMNDGEIKND
ncbi:MAG: ABC transporter ATP-binding protein, partial [Spirochaetia bacterium]|nr:ABC transporter ATP-binding protein [Spirochaetia bacterium]